MKRLMLLIMTALPLILMAQQYSLDDLIQQGMEQSWTTQRGRLSYESSASQLSSATWELLPDADLGLRINQNLHNQTAASDLSSSFNFSVSKTISLNDPAWNNFRQAGITKEKAALNLETSNSAYAYQVFDAYIKVLSAQKQLKSLTENLAIQSRVWEQAKVLRQLGKNTDFDVKQSEIAVMNSRISIMQLENTIRTNRQSLFGLVQITDEGHPLADLEPEKDYQIPELNADAVNEIKLLKAEIRSAKLSRNQSRLDFLPRLSLGYGLSRNISGDDFEFDTYSTTHNIYLNLSYSLWNQFTQHQSHKRADIGYRLAELELMDKTDELGRQYQNATQELQYLTRLDELYREKLEQSSQQIKIAEERYRLGLIELLELDKTRTDYIDADIAYNANRYQILSKQQNLNLLLSQKILGKW